MPNEVEDLKVKIREVGKVIGKNTLLYNLMLYTITPKNIMAYVADTIPHLTKEEAVKLMEAAYPLAHKGVLELFNEMF